MVQRKSMRVSDRAMDSLNDDDRITRLPIDVVHRIYSFLDTRFVVQTSLLSRRWRDTWKSHPHLKFEIDPTNGSKFPKFLHRFLSSREDNVELSTIDFRSNSISNKLLKRITMYAMSHTTQKLNIEDLNGKPTRRGVFDLSLFKSQFLQDLRLIIDVKFLKSPSQTWDLPALTTLNLQRVKFTADNSNNSIEFFSTFPNLKTLVLVNCRLSFIHTFFIKSRKLENLTMIRLHQNCQFVISAPRLLSFTYKGTPHFSLLANDLDSLESVNLETIYYDIYVGKQPMFVELMINTFHQLYKAKFLTLNRDALMFLSRFTEILKRRRCPFVRLQSLTLVEPPAYFISFADVITYFRSGSEALMVSIEHKPAASSSAYMGWNEQVIVRWKT